MPLADLLPGRRGYASRLPGRIDDLRGPASGIIMVPRHLAWPGLRECDLSDVVTRRSVYGMVLTKGKRNDVVRLLNRTLLVRDWPAISMSIHPKLRRWCERQFALDAAAVQMDPADEDGRQLA